MHTIPELDRTGLRNFALTTAAIIAVLFGLIFPWLLNVAWPKWPWIGAAGLAAWGLIAPMSLQGVYHTWMRFGLLLNKITTPIVLGIVFYLVFLPIGFCMRLSGWDAMSRRFDDDATSYKKKSEKLAKTRMEKPF